MKAKKLTREYLESCFKYNKDTDTLTWLKRPLCHFKKYANWYRFNDKHENAVVNSKGDYVRLDSKYINRKKIIDTLLGVEQKIKSKFHVQLYRNGERFYVGSFLTEGEADAFKRSFRYKSADDIKLFLENNKKLKQESKEYMREEAKRVLEEFKNRSNLNIHQSVLLKHQSSKEELVKPNSPKGIYVQQGKFIAKLNGRYLGTFNCIDGAINARLKAECELKIIT